MTYGSLTASELMLLIKGDWQLYTFFLIYKSIPFFDTSYITFLRTSLTNLLLWNFKVKPFFKCDK